MYNQKFWNERYATTEYLYGTDPNTFLAENVQMLAGPVLSLSEGEGRNAVFLATRGLHVLGVDCPKDIDMLMSIEKLQAEFPNLTPILVRELEREVREGEGHSGLASVVQFIARKEQRTDYVGTAQPNQ